MANVEVVKKFWNENPLWTGESGYTAGTKEFFEEHKKVYIEDCFAGKMDESVFSFIKPNGRVLDLGCGIGFWTIELAKRNFTNLVAADLTENSLALAKKRSELYKYNVEFRVENAEQLTFASESFDHVNCQGVIHHTPNTQACIDEIHRVLKPGGTASLSVYYKNVLIRNWRFLSFIGKWVYRIGARLKGRGREAIFLEDNPDEVVRLYDGKNNPIGKSYSRKEFLAMVEDKFEVEKVYYHFFPARSLPVALPKFLHRILDTQIPFMIYINLRKRK